MQRNYFWCILLLLYLLYGADASFGQPYLQGMVVDASNGTPLDSVRVGSSLYATTAFTRSDGTFSLNKGDTIPCRPDTQFIENIDEHTIYISFANRSFRFVLAPEPQPITITLIDLAGHTVCRYTLSPPHYSFAAGLQFSPGVYIVTVTGLKPAKILIASHTRFGNQSRKEKPGITVRLPDCAQKPSEADTIIFCKQGYTLAATDAKSVAASGVIALRQKHWIAWDCHSHSVLSDGGESIDTVVAHSFGTGGLDLYVNSEHGGVFGNDTLGLPIVSDPLQAAKAPRIQNGSGIPRWYSLSNYSWPKILSQRKRYPGKILLQGVEWNVPGHEHASVGFVNDNDQPAAIAEFEYRFDFNDNDTGRTSLKKNNNRNLHADALTALSWMQSRYPATSYCFINHPSREAMGPFYVDAFRDFNNAAPDICFGFEGMPGHHKTSIRGSYGYGAADRNRTWGGADYVLAEIGGLWDALLGEGRRFFTIVNSDFHYRYEAFFPGEYAKTWSTETDTGAQAWLDGLRTGEIFIAHGDLIDGLDFTVDDGISKVSMGSRLHTRAKEITVTIRFRSPAHNNNGASPGIDHIDLITGAITGKIDIANRAAYTNPTNPTTRVAVRFEAADCSVEKNWRVLRATLPCTRSTYFRLRGTNLAVGTAGEVDYRGNPEMDVDYENTEAKAWNDLWFYANPIFVYIK